MPSQTFLRRDLGVQVAGGLAAFLDTAGLVSWDDFGTDERPAPSVWPAYIGPDMPTAPDVVAVFTPGVRSFRGRDVTISIQVRLRGEVDGTADGVGYRAQQIHDTLNPNGFPLVHATLGAVRVGIVLPGDMLMIAPDSNRRHGAIQNFTIRTRRTPTTPMIGG